MNDVTNEGGVPAYESEADHLWDELARVEQLVRARVALWEREQDAAGKPLHCWGMVHVTREDFDHYLTQGFSPPQVRVAATAELATGYREAYFSAERRIQRRQAATLGFDSYRLAHLVRTFGLGRLDLDLLLLAILPEVDSRYRVVYGYLQNDCNRVTATVEMLTEILEQVESSRGAVPARLAAGAPLRAAHLLTVGDDQQPARPPGRRWVAADDRIVRYVLGDDTTDRDLPGAAGTEVVLGDGPLGHIVQLPAGRWDDYVASPGRLDQLTALTDWCALRGCDAATVVVLEGSRGSGRATTAMVMAAGAGYLLLAADTAALLASAEPWSSTVELVYREARLRGAALLWAGAEVLFSGAEPTRELTDLLDRAEAAQTLTFLSTLERWEPSGRPDGTAYLRIPFPEPDHDTRIRLWRYYLPPAAEFHPPAPDPALVARSLAAAFQLVPGQIVDAVATARATARVREPAHGLLTASDLTDGCRVQSGRRLTQLALRVEPRAGLTVDDLVLAPPSRRQLDELRARIAVRARLAQAGFERRLPNAHGLLVMFTGSSGTGKTMAAELLAHEQGVDLYKIDLSEVVSKYIGETEKNLRRVFREAEDANAILFFDEADALFGKRGEVREARDRWANIEVNFLLQGVEQFDGIVVLATNLRQNIDEAFMRRIHVVVEFRFPDAADRLRIWQRMFPPPEQMGRPPDEELRLLAERFPIPGGSIRNVVIDAAVRALDAAADPPRVTLRHLVTALARDYQKLGRPLTAVEFGSELYRWVEEDVLLSVPAGA